MYRWSRAAYIAAGKMEGALAWAQEIAAYVSANYGIDVAVGLEAFGEVGRVHWFSEPESLAQWEEINAKLMADPAYMAKINEAADLFMAGTTKDTLVMLLPST